MKTKQELLEIYNNSELSTDEIINEFTGNFKGREIVPAENEFNTVETVEKQNLILTIIKTWKGTPSSCKYNEADLIQTRLNLEDVEIENRINAYIEGEEDQELEQVILDAAKYDIDYMFYQNENYNLFEDVYYSIIQKDHAADEIEIILNPDYNILIDYITDLDGYYYDSTTQLYNMLVQEDQQQQYNHYTVQQEAINDICWNITQEYIESYPATYSNLKPELTAEEITAFYTPEYLEILEAANLQKLTGLIQEAYKQIIQDINNQVKQNYNNYLEDVYYPAIDAAESYYFNNQDILKEALK